MLKIHTKNGDTLRLDLNDENQASSILTQLKNKKFQEEITAVSILKTCDGRQRCNVCGRPVRSVCDNCGEEKERLNCSTLFQLSLPKPVNHKNTFYYFEKIELENNKGGERLVCFSDEIKISLMVHSGQPAARLGIVKIGEQKFNPYLRVENG